jgi:predicted Zn-dependent peptidase
MKKLMIVLVTLIMISGFLSAGYDFSKIKDNISEFTLPNGLKFILLEDHSVPIATFVTHVNVGGTDERIGIWGISHFLEHMAFKGTAEVGTNNSKAEQKLMREMDNLFDKILAEENSLNPDKEKLEKMKAQLEEMKKKATTYVVPNEFDTVVKKNGGVGMNAGTSKDSTVYFYSLPSNRIELWAYLESARFSKPVFREFYKERGVIQEERRVRIENSPIPKMLEELYSVAFKDHPYSVNGIGPMSNINNITRPQMYAYFKANYTAGNMVIGVAGDVYPDQLKKIAKKYFSNMIPGPRNSRIITTEPKQESEKAVTLYEDSMPILAVVYHCPSQLHKDFIKFSVLDKIITSGRSSRLYKKMVIKEKVALEIISFAGLPGNKYPGLYLLGLVPTTGHSNDEMLKMLDNEIEAIVKEGITEEELKSAKTRVKIEMIKGLNSNQGLMMSLLSAEIIKGSWKKAFDGFEALEKITAKDIQELVKNYLIKTNRTIGRIEKKEEVKK